MRSERAFARPGRLVAALLAVASLGGTAFPVQTGASASGRRTAPPKAERVDVPPMPDGYDLPPYTRVVLPNGLTLLVMEQHEVPVVNMRLVAKSGAADEPKGKAGLASITAELLKSGTTARTAQQIASEVDFVGGALDSSADYDVSSVATQFVAKDADKQLEILSDVVLRPAFAQPELERVKQQRLAEIAALPEDARGYASAQFEAALFEGTAYGHPTAGLTRTVQGITRDDVVNFYRSHYAPSNSVLAVVGDFETEAMIAKLKAAFGGWESRPAPQEAFGTPKPIKGRRVVLVDSPDATQTQIRIGNVGIARNDPDFYAASVANTLFGGTFNARLMMAIRVQRSLSYGAYSRYRARLHPGPFVIETFTKNDTVRETIDVALEELARLRNEPIPAEEIQKAKNFMLGQFPLGIETVDGLATMLTVSEVYDLPKDYVETYATKVRSLTPQEIAAVVKRRFPIDDLLILVVTPQAETRKQIESLGPIDVRSYIE